MSERNIAVHIPDRDTSQLIPSLAAVLVGVHHSSGMRLLRGHEPVLRNPGISLVPK